MMTASLQSDDGKILLLGLTRENVKRLMSGLPVKVTRKVHGEAVPEGLSILIMYGETEMAMKRELEAHGLVTPNTKTTIDPRLQ